MNEREAINWIHQQLKFGIKPGLKRVEYLLSQLNHPEQKLKIIHVAGTNGKGSTVSYLRHILQAHNFEVGTFTSPYIEVFNERISINGHPINGENLVKYVQMIKPLCEQLGDTDLGKPTEFEIITVIALQYFSDMHVDYVIFEVGLGGRLDSTNVISPLLSIITMIGYDHTDILGETIEEIAYEKAGIIKEQTPVITNVLNTQAFKVIEKKAHLMNSSLSRLNVDYSYKWLESHDFGESFAFSTSNLEISRVLLNMSGRHQIENATLAIFSFIKLSELEGFSYSIEKIIRGIEGTKWIGRFEIYQKHPTIILDGAHNLEAINQLIETIEQRYENKHVHILLSIVKNKPIEPMLQTLTNHFDHITFATFNFFKSYRQEELLPKFGKYGIIVSENWKQLIRDFKNKQDSQEVLVITGSLYFVSEVRNFLAQTEINAN